MEKEIKDSKDKKQKNKDNKENKEPKETKEVKPKEEKTVNETKEKIDPADSIKLEILKLLESLSTITSIEISEKFKTDHQLIVGYLKSLEMMEKVKLIQNEKKYYALLPDGKEIVENGSPENIFMKFVQENINDKKQINQSQIKGKISKEAETRGFSTAMKLKVISIDKENNITVLKEFESNNDPTREQLTKIYQDSSNMNVFEEKVIKELTKGKLIKLEQVKFFVAEKGLSFSLDITKPEADLTTELISNDKYKSKQFKKFNYNTMGQEVNNGSLHPLLRVRTQFREIMLELGFQEMPTNSFVESSFWNFDTLFQPQQHPARDAHDTYFLTNPKNTDKVKKLYPEYFENVKKVHEEGGYGSLGWKYKFSEEETLKNILRTHTTAVSSRMLFKLAQDYKQTGVFTPKKYFSIDRVFRNESLDKTHLCEFHQIEGLVADYNLGLGHLIGTIEDFFLKFGITKLRFKPAYNPYTEPSMEIFSYHDEMKKWVEIGNSGIFRPEMLAPMGLPENVTVLAWGLSLERPTMIHYKYNSIKKLFGEEVQLRDTKNAKIYCINL